MIIGSYWLHQVQATHPYAGEDIDELTFDKDEMIFVVPFAEPDEQVSNIIKH